MRVTTDSTYVRDGITRWLPQWKRRGWKTAEKKPVKNVDLGIEYRHGERKLVSGAQGGTDRIEFAAKYSF